VRVYDVGIPEAKMEIPVAGSRDEQWIKKNDDGKLYILTVHYDLTGKQVRYLLQTCGGSILGACPGKGDVYVPVR